MRLRSAQWNVWAFRSTSHCTQNDSSSISTLSHTHTNLTRMWIACYCCLCVWVVFWVKLQCLYSHHSYLLFVVFRIKRFTFHISDKGPLLRCLYLLFLFTKWKCHQQIMNIWRERWTELETTQFHSFLVGNRFGLYAFFNNSFDSIWTFVWWLSMTNKCRWWPNFRRIFVTTKHWYEIISIRLAWSLATL